ncbi:hypothetical protein [Sinomonas sp.]
MTKSAEMIDPVTGGVAEPVQRAAVVRQPQGRVLDRVAGGGRSPGR